MPKVLYELLGSHCGKSNGGGVDCGCGVRMKSLTATLSPSTQTEWLTATLSPSTQTERLTATLSPSTETDRLTATLSPRAEAEWLTATLSPSTETEWLTATCRRVQRRNYRWRPVFNFVVLNRSVIFVS